MRIDILRARIKTKSTVDSVTGCWNWTGPIGHNGRGFPYPKYDDGSAPRKSYEAFREKPPRGIFVLHACGNRMCVNPEHLVRTDDLKARILGNTAVDPETGCWNWTGSLRDDGYGRLCFKDGPVGRGAHILSFEVFAKPIPDGAHVLHRCDNPPCCNPKHLFLGTHLENVADMVSKNRQAIGEKNGEAKLSESQVYEVHCMHKYTHFSTRELATFFDVNQPQISRILTGKRWPHIKAQIDAVYSQQE